MRALSIIDQSGKEYHARSNFSFSKLPTNEKTREWIMEASRNSARAESGNAILDPLRILRVMTKDNANAMGRAIIGEPDMGAA